MATKIKRVRNGSEQIVNDAPRTFSDADFPVGTVAHQGDVILVRIRELPRSAKPRKNRQLAIGETQGARHMLKVGSAYDCDANHVISAVADVCRVMVRPEYVGPVFTTKGGRASVVHPEHGNQHFLGDMAVACIYQRSLDQEDREQRVQD